MTMRSPLISILSAVVLSAAATGPGHAQVGYVTTTLEGMVAGSDVVVRARVAAVARGAVKESRRRETVALKIAETIRGPETAALMFSHGVLASAHIFEAWRDAGREHLFFLVRRDAQPERAATAEEDPTAGHPLALSRVVRLAPPVPAEAGYGPPGQGPWTLPIFDRDLSLLSEPEAILRAARAAAAEWRGRRPAEVHPIDLPRVVMQRSGRSGDANRLEVPICPHLEALARRMIASSDDFVSLSDFRAPRNEAERQHVETWLAYSRGLLRLEGVRGLRHFRSDANIALLKPLLDDPAYHGLNKRENGVVVLADGVPITIGREYYVRGEAYATLRSWGVNVNRPVIEVLERPPRHVAVRRRRAAISSPSAPGAAHERGACARSGAGPSAAAS
jgi:hypothetical protein